MKGKKNTYTIRGFDDESSSLALELQKLGLQYQQGQFGGGPGKVVQETIAWVSLNKWRFAIFTNLAATFIAKVMKVGWNWYRQRWKRKGVIPAAQIFIHPRNKNSEGICLTLRMDREYTISEIRAEIRKVEDREHEA